MKIRSIEETNYISCNLLLSHCIISICLNVCSFVFLNYLLFEGKELSLFISIILISLRWPQKQYRGGSEGSARDLTFIEFMPCIRAVYLIVYFSIFMTA